MSESQLPFSLPPPSPLNTFLLAVTFLALILGIFLYIFQGKLPPGSRVEVWQPSRFGYGPGIIKFNNKNKSKKCCDHDHKDDDCHDNANSTNEQQIDSDNLAWEEIELITPDNVKLQAYWLKAPSKLNNEGMTVKRRNIDDNSVPHTILYMQANAGNIVSLMKTIERKLN